MIEVEYQHDEEAHERGDLCAACTASLAALPVFVFNCPACGSGKYEMSSCGIMAEWLTCLDCGWRKHMQSGRIEIGRVWSSYTWRRF